MLQIWKWISTGEIVYGYADKGLDCVIGANDSVGIMVLNGEGKRVLYCTQGELKRLASFQGYRNSDWV